MREGSRFRHHEGDRRKGRRQFRRDQDQHRHGLSALHVARADAIHADDRRARRHLGARRHPAGAHHRRGAFRRHDDAQSARRNPARPPGASAGAPSRRSGGARNGHLEVSREGPDRPLCRRRRADAGPRPLRVRVRPGVCQSGVTRHPAARARGHEHLGRHRARRDSRRCRVPSGAAHRGDCHGQPHRKRLGGDRRPSARDGAKRGVRAGGALLRRNDDSRTPRDPRSPVAGSERAGARPGDSGPAPGRPRAPGDPDRISDESNLVPAPAPVEPPLATADSSALPAPAATRAVAVSPGKHRAVTAPATDAPAATTEANLFDGRK